MLVSEDLFGHTIVGEGNISSRCQVHSENGTKFIMLDGGLTFSYQESDNISKRMVWSEIYEQGFVTYKQAAKGAEVRDTTVKNWVKRYREFGYAGLQDKKGKGSVKKIDDKTRKYILELRSERKSLREIARIVNCSHVAVLDIINESNKNHKASPSLNLENTEEIQVEEIQVEEIQVEEEIVSTEEFYSERLLDDKVEARNSKNRNGDRAMAVAGKLDDATPYFAPCKHVEYAGIFMAFVILSQDAYFKIGMKVFKSIGPAFFGLRTTLVTLITLALLRIKRPEHLLRDNPKKLGKLLGLDRVLSVKTCRRKIEKLSQPIETIKYMEELGNERFKEYNGESKIIMVDGHTVGYTGEKKVGSTWSSRDNKIIKSHTENWVNLKGNAPLFSFETDFNNGLVSSLEEVLDKTKKALNVKSLTCVFDRGGSSALLFENLTKKGYGLITYQKGNYDKIDEDKFKKVDENNYKKTISIGAKDYKHLPFEQEVILRINEKKDNAFNKRPGSRDTKRTIAMRDIRILCKDGHQVSILANKNVKVSAVEIADIMFNRIGSQENIFKYMREEFDVDGLVSYKFEDVDENTFHPNPQWIKQEKKIAKLRKKEMKLLAKISKKMIFEESAFIKETIDDFSEKDTVFLLNKINDLPNEITKKEGAKILKNLKLPSTLKEKFVVDIFKELKASNINTREALIKILKEVIVIKTLTQDEILGKLKILKEYEYANEILELNKKIKMEKKILDKINFKENAQKNGYQKPKAEPKRLMNIVKMAAYAIETKLFDILAKHYKYNKNDGRALLKSAFKSTGSLKLKPGEIVIKLDEQATPQRTRAINSLIDELSAKNVQFPGSQRIIRFEQTKIKNT